MPSKLRIILDLDEVLTDFDSAAAAAHGTTRDEINAKRVPGQWSLIHPLGVDLDGFWAPIHAAGTAFWEEMQLLPWAKDLLKLAYHYDQEFVIATSPSPIVEGYIGKVNFMAKHRLVPLSRLIITPHKHLLAKPGRVLVDDYIENIGAFCEEEGHGCLFPTLGNINWPHRDDPVGFVARTIESIKKGI